ncbi:MAG: MASE3 domain-containing protein [Desulfuromonadales bacterium]|nr:MASE3 domain-containing protein [Desulfuromonadales bacterium]
MRSPRSETPPPAGGPLQNNNRKVVQSPLLRALLVAGATILLFLISRTNYLLFHVLVEMSSIALATAVFLVGWNSRRLVESPTLLILAMGFFFAALVDLLHTLAYKGMAIFPGATTDLATQLWIVARYLSAVAFTTAAFSLIRPWPVCARRWLAGYSVLTLLLLVVVWPLGLFPACFVDGVGLTRFKVFSEYLVVALMAAAALLIWWRRERLSLQLTWLLLLAILSSILSEYSLTLYNDPYGFSNFLGHLFKLCAVIAIYAALVRGTLRDPYHTLFRELTRSKEALEAELARRRRSETEKEEASRELVLLYRIARTLHRTMQIDALSHLILSAATAPEGGGFQRATLFTVNLRTQTLQGMLGIDRPGSNRVLPVEDGPLVWEQPRLDESVLDAQRRTEFNRMVIKQRLALDAGDNPLARAYLDSRVEILSSDESVSPGFRQLVTTLGLGPAACVPLLGRKEILGVLLVEVADAKSFPVGRKRFLEMFARQAGDAMENAQLLHRLAQTHEELRDVQERLIEGEKLSVLGEMAAQVAHELKNPLVSIGGFARRLSRLDLGEARANEYAAIIAREVQRLEEMLGNILAFSRKQLVSLEECDLAALVQEVVELEQDNCRRQGVTVRVDTDGAETLLIGDCRQLRQVLHNLLINARQAMPHGGEIAVRIHRGLLRGDMALCLEVEDTGGGIPAEIIRNIFNPFFSTRGKGTGLGLSISHRIVAHHHGEIEVVNSERGARFIVRLPMRPPTMVDGRDVRD